MSDTTILEKLKSIAKIENNILESLKKSKGRDEHYNKLLELTKLLTKTQKIESLKNILEEIQKLKIIPNEVIKALNYKYKNDFIEVIEYLDKSDLDSLIKLSITKNWEITGENKADYKTKKIQEILKKIDANKPVSKQEMDFVLPNLPQKEKDIFEKLESMLPEPPSSNRDKFNYSLGETHALTELLIKESKNHKIEDATNVLNTLLKNVEFMTLAMLAEEHLEYLPIGNPYEELSKLKSLAKDEIGMQLIPELLKHIQIIHNLSTLIVYAISMHQKLDDLTKTKDIYDLFRDTGLETTILDFRLNLDKNRKEFILTSQQFQKKIANIFRK